MSKINFFALLIILSSTYAEPATAHAVVTKHTLEITPIQSGKASQVTLTFNSKIELGLSKFQLVRTGDKHEPLHFQKVLSLGR